MLFHLRCWDAGLFFMYIWPPHTSHIGRHRSPHIQAMCETTACSWKFLNFHQCVNLHAHPGITDPRAHSTSDVLLSWRIQDWSFALSVHKSAWEGKLELTMNSASKWTNTRVIISPCWVFPGLLDGKWQGKHDHSPSWAIWLATA